MEANSAEGLSCSGGHNKLSGKSHTAKRGGIGRAQRLLDKIKGSRHDPLFYLGGAAAFLFIFLSLGIGLFGFDKNGGVILSYAAAKSSSERSALFMGDNRKTALEPPAFILVQNYSVKPALPTAILERKALGALIGTTEDLASEHRSGVVEYEVESGDTISSIAEKFGLAAETILWANNLAKTSTLKPGKVLVILPVDGVIYHVKNGDTISDIAKTYQGKTDEISAFNNLASAGDILVGDILIIPGGKMPVVKSKPVYVSQPAQIPTASTYFICPLGTPCNRLTQGLHWYNAVDIDGECGDPIRAAASGQVLKVALTNSTSKWALNGAGNHLTILHPNGTVTYYGHVQSVLQGIVPGQSVDRGRMIATMGGQPGTPGAGLSTGCHLHFGVTGAKNPLAR